MTHPAPLPTIARVAPAAFACRPEESRGRLYAEPVLEGRSEFQRDRDRIVHSSAFRRLQYKTQVFVYHEGDHYRTRLTHSLEVAQIARSIARALGLNEDLAEALALAHDLGHTPFGHAGEDALGEAMRPLGTFDHNEQTLRILTSLERRYLDFDGLNLTWEALEGVVKHNGPIHRPPPSIAEYNHRHDLWLDSYAGAEAQVAAMSDDIAYNNHDIDDGLRAGLFALQDIADLPLIGPVLAPLLGEHGDADPSRLAHELVRRLINIMVADLIDETRRRIAEHDPRSADAVRRLGRPLVGFSETMQANDRALKSFLFEHMYRHYKVNRMTSKARRVLKDLYRLYSSEPGLLPTEWRRQVERQDEVGRARLIADYIAGMTDRFALNEHERLFDLHARP
jgi:dGTPase